MFDDAPEEKVDIDSEHELTVIKCIIEQFNKFSNRPKVAAISDEIIKIVGEEKLELGSLRTQISEIYKQESSNPGQYSALFYNALFSFLLILAKYNPTNERDEASGELQCAISWGDIKARSRLLTTAGAHFDLESSADWFSNHETNPATGEALSQRELDYLRSRLEDHSTVEIPHPKTLPRHAPSLFSRYINYVKRDAASAILGIFPTMVIAIGLMIGITFAAPSIGAGMLLVNLALFITALMIGAPMGVYVQEALDNRRNPDSERLRLSGKDRPRIPPDSGRQLLGKIQKFASQSRPCAKIDGTEEKSVSRSSYSEYSKQLAMQPANSVVISISNSNDEDPPVKPVVSQSVELTTLSTPEVMDDCPAYRGFRPGGT